MRFDMGQITSPSDTGLLVKVFLNTNSDKYALGNSQDWNVVDNSDSQDDVGTGFGLVVSFSDANEFPIFFNGINIKPGLQAQLVIITTNYLHSNFYYYQQFLVFRTFQKR